LPAAGRPGYTAGYKNQSLSGIGLRLLPAPGRSLLLVVVAVVVAGWGLYRACQATARGRLVAGATLTGLAGVLASPVSWIHATVWILPALGLTVGGVASRRRIAVAAAVTVALLAALPYGPNVVPGLPPAVVQLLRASFGLICLGFLLALPASTSPADGPIAPPAAA
jgi:alpha-1,2-mannosyltransferase